MGKIVNAVTNIEQEIIYKCEKRKCGHKYRAGDNLQMRKKGNAVTSIAQG